MSFPVICTSCAATAHVNKITAGLRHGCGGEVDLYLGTPDQLRAVAARQADSFADWMGRTASGDRSGEEDSRSGEYAGPMPGPNPMSNHEGEITCPTCHGSGRDLQDATDPCRECGGDGKVTPTTTPEDRWKDVYKHRYPSTQTTVPFMGRRKQASTRRTAMIQSVARTNRGMSRRQVEALVDETLRRYPEVR